MQEAAAKSASALISRDLDDQESYRIAQSILHILRDIPAEPVSSFALSKGTLASNLADATKDPKQRTALYAEAQKILRAHIAADPVNIERSKGALAHSLIWEAALSNDAAVKKTRYAEAQTLLDAIAPHRPVHATQMRLWQFQARDAEDATTHNALLTKVEKMAQEVLGQEKDPLNQSLYHTTQAISAALKGDAVSSLALLKTAMEISPDRKERYEMYIRHSQLYESVRNDPAFAHYMQSLRGSNSGAALQR